jgi:ectoine hydroxylase-related dioxygenase (phytanoyl-CoA dioxygenase family)
MDLSTYDQINAKKLFKKNGVIVIRGLIDPQDIIACNATLKYGMDKISGQDTIGLIESLTLAFQKSSEQYRAYLRTFAKSVKVQSLFLNKKILGVIEDLGVVEPSTPTTPVTHIVSEKLSEAGIEKVATTSHQDWPSIQGSIDSLIVWIPLTNVNENSYPVQIIPGSHAEGLRECTAKSNVSQITLSNDEEMRYIDVVCNPGDVIIFSTFLIHRTKLTGDSARIAVSNRFDNMFEKSFIERSFPCAYVRIVDRNLVNVPDNAYIKKTLNGI